MTAVTGDSRGAHAQTVSRTRTMRVAPPPILALMLPALQIACQAAPAEAPARAKSVQWLFTCDGKPIHPKLVRQFMGWLSDVAPPVVITVDVNSAVAARNEYDLDDVQVRNGLVSYVISDGGPVQQEWFGYRWLGTLHDGTHVLQTVDCGGGSAVWMGLLFVRLHFESSRLLMTVVHRRGYGDRNPADVRVLSDRVVVGEGHHGIEHYPSFEITVEDLE